MMMRSKREKKIGKKLLEYFCNFVTLEMYSNVWRRNEK